MEGGELVRVGGPRQGLPLDDVGLVPGVRLRGCRRQKVLPERNTGRLSGQRARRFARLGPHGGLGLRCFYLLFLKKLIDFISASFVIKEPFTIVIQRQ